MELKHITSQSLRRLLTLTERKDELVSLVGELENEIAKVLTGAVAPVAPIVADVQKSLVGKPSKARKTRKKIAKVKSPQAVETPAADKPAKPASAKVRKGSPLRKRIAAVLDEAGAKGIRIKDIAAKLNVPSGNISVWMATTGKKVVTKLSTGVYASKKAVASQAPAAPATPSPVAPKVAKSRKPAKVRKAPKAAAKKGFQVGISKGAN